MMPFAQHKNILSLKKFAPGAQNTYATTKAKIVFANVTKDFINPRTAFFIIKNAHNAKMIISNTKLTDI